MPTLSETPVTIPDSPPDSRSHSPSTKATAISLSKGQEDPLSRSPPHLDTFKWFDSVMFELNGVFLLSPEDSKVDKRTKGIRYDVVTSLAWSKFEKCLIDFKECRAQILAKFDFSENEITDAIDLAVSWRVSPDMLSLATELQSTHSIYAIGNLPQPVLDGLITSDVPLNLFKDIFISSKLNERLPHPLILTRVLNTASLNTASLDPPRTLYIGGNIDNVITARSFGFYSIKCGDPAQCVQHALRICHEPIAKAKAWLKSNAGELDLETSLGITVKDTYMQYCILDATDDKSLIYYDPDERLFSWYYGPIPKGLQQFPPDVDCNSLAYSVFDHLDDTTRQGIMDRMLQFVDSE